MRAFGVQFIMPPCIFTKLINVTSISGDHRESSFVLRSPFAAHLSLLLLFVLSFSEALPKILGVELGNVEMRFSPALLRRLANVCLLWKPSEGRMVQDPTEPKHASSLWLGRLSLASNGAMRYEGVKRELLCTVRKRKGIWNEKWSKLHPLF